MSRIYVCDRCVTKFTTWSTTPVEFPAASFFVKAKNFDLCTKCLGDLHILLNKFMEEKF
jgi:hypothetical protein